MLNFFQFKGRLRLRRGDRWWVMSGRTLASVGVRDESGDLTNVRALTISIHGEVDGEWAEVEVLFPDESAFAEFLEQARRDGNAELIIAAEDEEIERGRAEQDRWRCVQCDRDFVDGDSILTVDKVGYEETHDLQNGLQLHEECVVPYRQAALGLWRELGFLPPDADPLDLD